MQNTERVLFVSMPFASSSRPSLGLSLLQAELQEVHISSYIWYPFFPIISKIGTDLYEEIADGNYPNYYMIGEWIFAPWLMSDPQDTSGKRENDADYLHYLQRRRVWLEVPYFHGISQQEVERIVQVRQLIPAFFQNALQTFDWNAVQLVGFTSVFQQHVASLAFARILKERYPHLTIVFGGANVEGPMGRGTLRSFPWVDAVVSGEGDNVIVPLAQAVLNGEDYSQIPGVWTRRGLKPTYPPRVQMDALPYPLFDDFFDQYAAVEHEDKKMPAILVETSRGCWWGEHSHCTFCGLNGLNMAYRSKSPQRAVQEITALWDRYADRAGNVLAVDNILDYRYINTVLPRLAEYTNKFSLFYETKANLKKQQIDAFARANIKYIQPGIESLSTHVLKVMRKGVSALSNVQMLKWCQEYGLKVYWNILWGFPGEHPEDYVEASAWASRLFHLLPPQAVTPIRLDRFSPLFDASDDFGVTDIKPVLAYDLIFDALSPQERFDLAYFFEFDYQEKPGLGYATDLTRTVARWIREHDKAALYYFPVGTEYMLVDTRTDSRIWLLDQEYIALLDAIDAIAIKSDLAERLNIEPELLTAMLHILDEHQWIIEEGNRVVGLPIRLGRYQPSGKAKGALATLFDPETGQATVSGRITVPVTVS